MTPVMQTDCIWHCGCRYVNSNICRFERLFTNISRQIIINISELFDTGYRYMMARNSESIKILFILYDS